MSQQSSYKFFSTKDAEYKHTKNTSEGTGEGSTTDSHNSSQNKISRNQLSSPIRNQTC